jgi:hypothetical protein
MFRQGVRLAPTTVCLLEHIELAATHTRHIQVMLHVVVEKLSI